MYSNSESIQFNLMLIISLQTFAIPDNLLHYKQSAWQPSFFYMVTSNKNNFISAYSGCTMAKKKLQKYIKKSM